MKVQGCNDTVLMQKVALASMNDKDLRTLAYMASHENKSKISPMNKALIALPVVTGVASSILTKGSLATRMGAGLLRGAGWAVPLMAFGVFNKTENVALGNSSKLRKFREKNPLTYALTSAGMFLGGLILASKGLGKVTAKLANKINLAKEAAKLTESVPKLVSKSNLGDKVVQAFIKCEKLFKSAAASIDASVFNQKALPKFERASAWLGEKLPFVKTGLKSILNFSSWILVGGGMLKSVNQSSQVTQKANNNYVMLKEAQMEAKEELAELFKESNEDVEVLAEDVENVEDAED